MIVGAGPAGLMAAELLSRAGLPVEVHEAMPSAARKFLMAGRGGLNLTHGEPLNAFAARYGEAAQTVMAWIAAFPPDALRDWAHDLGQPTFIGSSGRVFPQAMKASPLLRAWLARLEAQGVRLVLNSRWTGFHDGHPRFEATRPTASPLTGARPARALVVATGGASWPRLGSDGQGLSELTALGARARPFHPANAGVRVDWSPAFAQAWAGQPLKAVAVTLDGQSVRGELMVTGQGLEGGAVYALGPRLRATVQAQGQAVLALDLRPGQDRDVLERRLQAVPRRLSAGNRLRRAFRLSPLEMALMREVPMHEAWPQAAAATDAERTARLKAVPLKVVGIQGLERAISSAGGLSLAGLTSGLMLRDHPGLFAAGELLDWEAPTGGYLLQAVMASGRVAAQGVRDWMATSSPVRPKSVQSS